MACVAYYIQQRDLPEKKAPIPCIDFDATLVIGQNPLTFFKQWFMNIGKELKEKVDTYK